MIFWPLLLLLIVAYANSPQLWVAYGFGYLWFVRRSSTRSRRS